MEHGPPLAFYSSSIIAFCGAYSDDRRFFGLVTSTGSRKKHSCHVFMVEPKLLSHSEHSRRARCFGIHCTALSMPKNGQVLGLQECAEFPATADSILNSIVLLHRPQRDELTTRSPSEASTRLESTNSSNSDSGIGFRDDCDRNSVQIYDILQPEAGPSSNKSATSARSPQSRRKNSPAMRKLSHQHDCKTRKPSGSSGVGSFQYSDVFAAGTGSVGGGKSSISFDMDPKSLQEILGTSDFRVRNMPSTSKDLRQSSRDRLSLDGQARQPPQPIEVAVLVTPSRGSGGKRHRNRSKEVISPILNEELNKSNPHRASVSRHNGTRSLENLCAADEDEVIVPTGLDSRNSIGSSTPALNQVNLFNF